MCLCHSCRGDCPAGIQAPGEGHCPIVWMGNTSTRMQSSAWRLWAQVSGGLGLSFNYKTILHSAPCARQSISEHPPLYSWPFVSSFPVLAAGCPSGSLATLSSLGSGMDKLLSQKLEPQPNFTGTTWAPAEHRQFWLVPAPMPSSKLQGVVPVLWAQVPPLIMFMKSPQDTKAQAAEQRAHLPEATTEERHQANTRGGEWQFWKYVRHAWLWHSQKRGCAGFLGGWQGSGGCILLGPGSTTLGHPRAIVVFLLLGNEHWMLGLNIVVDFNRKCFQIEMTLITAGWIIYCE